MSEATRSDFTAAGTGYRWEAMLFVTMWEELERRFGRDVARDISVNVMKKGGIRFGQAIANIWGGDDLAHLRDAWESLYGANPENEWSGKRFVVHGEKCIIKDTFDLLGLPEDLRAELDQMFCSGDQAFVEGFNPRVQFSFGGRIMRGDARCSWIMEDPSEVA